MKKIFSIAFCLIILITSVNILSAQVEPGTTEADPKEDTREDVVAEDDDSDLIKGSGEVLKEESMEKMLEELRDDKDQKDDKKSDFVDISGMIFVQYKVESFNSNGTNSFDVSRFYLTLKKEISENWHLRFSSDIGIFGSGTKYEFHAKYGYIEYDNSFGAVALKAQFGLLGTPVVDFYNDSSDMEWVSPTLMLWTGSIVQNSIDMDPGADLGFKLQCTIKKNLTLTAMVNNGEGYKNINLSDRGKNLYGMATLHLMKKMYLNGFYKRNMDDWEQDNYDHYYGGGVLWKSRLLKSGMNFMMEKKVAGNSVANKIMLFGWWLNVNFDSVLGLPVLFYGRIANVEDSIADASTVLFGVGAGYEFVEHVRLMFWLETCFYRKVFNNNMIYYVKAEARF
ncbi:MAG: hypothetical protein GY754_29820 [bacterium]|nr:hypothetical protein [bacterium]